MDYRLTSIYGDIMRISPQAMTDSALASTARSVVGVGFIEVMASCNEIGPHGERSQDGTISAQDIFSVCDELYMRGSYTSKNTA